MNFLKTFFITLSVLAIVLFTLASASATADQVMIEKVQLDSVAGSIIGQYWLYNAGTTPATLLLEQQVRSATGTWLSVVASHQDTCDPTHPENVHKIVYLDGGSRGIISLSSPSIPYGKYQIWGLLASGCYADDPTGFKLYKESRLADFQHGIAPGPAPLPVFTPQQPTVETGEGSQASVTVAPRDGTIGAVGAGILWKPVLIGLAIMAASVLSLAWFPLGAPLIQFFSLIVGFAMITLGVIV